jgi:phosphoserine/homoserine phosphotransferase
MWCVCFDCEGVLTPEAWLAVQRKTGIEGLKITTREEPDYDKLMMYRIKLLKENQIKLEDIKKVVQDMEPLDGAQNLLQWLYPRCPRIIILTDTFENYAQPMFDKLGNFTVFCHSLEVDDEGYLVRHKLRLIDQKKKSVEALQELNFKCVAIGDSYNDISMLKQADRGILFRPSEKVKAEFPEFPVVYSHAELQQLLESILAA